jgi:hypothetical protein
LVGLTKIASCQLLTCAVSFLEIDNLFNPTTYNNQVSDVMTVPENDQDSIDQYKGHSTETWEEIGYTITDENHISLGRPYKGIRPLIYVQIGPSGRTKTCKEEHLITFHVDDFYQYKGKRGKFKDKRPTIGKNGTVWVGNTKEQIVKIDKKKVKIPIFGFRVYVLKNKKEEN